MVSVDLALESERNLVQVISYLPLYFPEDLLYAHGLYGLHVLSLFLEDG